MDRRGEEVITVRGIEAGQNGTAGGGVEGHWEGSGVLRRVEQRDSGGGGGQRGTRGGEMGISGGSMGTRAIHKGTGQVRGVLV